MASSVPGLYAAEELRGGANGANRLSGNALPEAVVFGERAGEKAAGPPRDESPAQWDDKAAQRHLDLYPEGLWLTMQGAESRQGN